MKNSINMAFIVIQFQKRYRQHVRNLYVFSQKDVAEKEGIKYQLSEKLNSTCKVKFHTED